MDRVTLLGEVEPARLSRELEWAQLAILPSHEESFGLSVAEAHVAGLPVIVYDVGAIREILSPGETGWAVPCGRIDLLAAAILEALDQPEETQRRGSRASERGQRLVAHSPAERILDVIRTWDSKTEHGHGAGAC